MRHTKTAALEFKFDGQSREISGYASVFDVRDSYGDVIRRGAFAKTLQRRIPLMFWQHQTDAPIGVWLTASEDARGLRVSGRLADTGQGRDVHELLKMGALSGLSIGFTVPPGGETFDGQIRTLTEIDLWEISPVSFPANDSARIDQVKSSLRFMPIGAQLDHMQARLDERAMESKLQMMDLNYSLASLLARLEGQA